MGFKSKPLYLESVILPLHYCASQAKKCNFKVASCLNNIIAPIRKISWPDSAFLVQTNTTFIVIQAEILRKNLKGGLDSVVDNPLSCHLCSTGSNPGRGMWHGSGHPHITQHPRLRERVNKFLELSV